MIAEIENPATQRKVLAVSLHLHSGIERDEYFTERIVVAQLEGRIPNQGESRKILAALAQDQERRLEELRTLVRKLRMLQTGGALCWCHRRRGLQLRTGLARIPGCAEAGLKDTYMLARHTGEIRVSYSPMILSAIRLRSTRRRRCPALSSVVQAMPKAEREKIVAGYRRGLRMNRRIDFIFVMRSGAGRSKCLSQAGVIRNAKTCYTRRRIGSLWRAGHIHDRWKRLLMLVSPFMTDFLAAVETTA